MKKKTILLILFTFFLILRSVGQNNEIRISGEISHTVHNKNLSGVPDYHFLGSKGLELAYFRELDHNWMIGLGGIFQWSTYYHEIDIRFDCNEIGFGVFLKKSFIHLNDGKLIFSSTLGMYNGIVTDTQQFLLRSGYWIRMYNSYLDEESDKKFFSDLYYDIECSIKTGNVGNISFAPFLKYRLKETWVNELYSGFQCGIKLCYTYSLL